MSASPGRFTAEFPELSNARVTDDENLRGALLRIAQAGRDVLSKSVAASVTIIEERRPMTAASTDDVALALDQAQYDVDDGPCLHAARTEQVVRLDDLSDDGHWPAFRRAALEHAIHS